MDCKVICKAIILLVCDFAWPGKLFFRYENENIVVYTHNLRQPQQKNLYIF